MGPQRQALPPATPGAAPRWHFQHGPIDLVIGADGDAAALAEAHADAWAVFDGLLATLVAELPLLRTPVASSGPNPLRGPVARRMWAVCAPLARPAAGWPGTFLTPMAAVAGAVAEHVVAAYRRPGIARAWVNNGGDIALHLAPGQRVQVGLVADIAAFDAAAWSRTVLGHGAPDGRFMVQADDPVRGIATSGWRGRSCSLGVADSVTVLAASAPEADAAATLVANAVNLPHPGIVRRPAIALRDDSDLGEIPVTVAVPAFTPAERQQALDAGLAVARQLQARGLLQAVVLACQGSLATLAPCAALQSAAA